MYSTGYHPYTQLVDTNGQQYYADPGSQQSSQWTSPSTVEPIACTSKTFAGTSQGSLQSFQWTSPTIGYSSISGYTSISQPVHRPRKNEAKRRWSIVLVLLIWTLLLVTSAILLLLAHTGTDPASDGGLYMTPDEIAGTVALSAIPNFLAIILNEVFIERCWRTIELFALDAGETIDGQVDNFTVANRLRASNIGWWSFIKRVCRCNLSSRELWAMISYLLLRWGTILAIASTQLCVRWSRPTTQSTNADALLLFYADKRLRWLVLPPAIHAVSIVGTFLMWRHSPFAIGLKRFDDFGLWIAYRNIFKRVPQGSTATAEDIAAHLEDPYDKPISSLSKRNKPGVQFLAKLEGIWFGVVFMFLPPTIALIYTIYVQHEPASLLGSGVFRFLLHFTFLAQNIMFNIAMDFIIWNVSLEGLCKPDPKAISRGKKRKLLRDLGKTTGLVLIQKIWHQGQPWRALSMLLLFSAQASLMRCLTVFYALCAQILKYGTIEDRKSLYDPYFWLGWLIGTCVLTFPPIILFLVWPFQEPICTQDRLRWAKVNEGRFRGKEHQDVGFYGVEQVGGIYRAAMGTNVMTFRETDGEVLE